MQQKLPNAPSRRAYYLLGALFVISRALFYAIGLRFDSTPLDTFWQFLDPRLLQHRLLESLWYMHSQPPLYNLFLGIVLKITPEHYTALFHTIYLGVGFWLTTTIYRLLREFDLSERTALLISSGFMLLPASIVFENWLFYDYPLAALFAAMTLYFLRFVKLGRTRDAALFFVMLTAVILMRALFHVVWVAAVVALLYYVAKDHRRNLIRAAVVPMLVISLFYVKNVVMFGSLTGSTWFGQHLSRVTTAEVDPKILDPLVENGTLTKAALIPAFSDLSVYEPLGLPKSHTGIPALDEERKPNNMENFNNLEYIAVSELYKRDALYVVTHYPGVMAISVLKSAYFYLRPANEFYMLKVPNEQLGLYRQAMRTIVYGQLGKYPDHTTKGQPGYDHQMWLAVPWFMLLLIPAILLYGGRRSWQAFKSRKLGISAQTATLVFVSLTLLYVSVIANIFEMGENNRIRFMMDPLFLLAGTLFIRDAVAYLRSRQRVGALNSRFPTLRDTRPELS